MTLICEWSCQRSLQIPTNANPNAMPNPSSLFNAARGPRTDNDASPAKRTAPYPNFSRVSASLRPPHLLPCQRKLAPQRMHYADQRILQLLLFFRLAGAPAAAPLPLVCATSSSSRPRTAVSIAVSKISCTPLISFDEHSMYIAPIFSATARPCCCVTGVRPCVLRSSIQVRFVRRSDLRPQRMMGVVGQK